MAVNIKHILGAIFSGQSKEWLKQTPWILLVLTCDRMEAFFLQNNSDHCPLWHAFPIEASNWGSLKRACTHHVNWTCQSKWSGPACQTMFINHCQRTCASSGLTKEFFEWIGGDKLLIRCDLSELCFHSKNDSHPYYRYGGFKSLGGQLFCFLF